MVVIYIFVSGKDILSDFPSVLLFLYKMVSGYMVEEVWVEITLGIYRKNDTHSHRALQEPHRLQYLSSLSG